ncbi:hypothetical protein [Sinorhizobium sp. BG8]|uniref:spike base protein, RCAP_Rcc01079 family n=1 Tax=Sinorhizobium sp. BG8 TaxID=2613773 RepID=UPI00193DD67F|nr:hypothetical protein [Sinorhizobium sp. BG8]QRM53919.1 hypothetical protein F3Y30_04640 [Sinorhizobium sp. BG8]
MTDFFSGYNASFDAPATHAFAITPDDGTDLPAATRALYIGRGGDLSVVMLSGDAVSFVNLVAGAIVPLRASRVLETGTTAEGLVGLY